MSADHCTVGDCGRPVRAGGLCASHRRRQLRGIPWDVPLKERPGPKIHPHHIEDVEWMAETGECLDGAAARLDVSPDTLERHLLRHKRNDLVRILRARNYTPAT